MAVGLDDLRIVGVRSKGIFNCRNVVSQTIRADLHTMAMREATSATNSCAALRPRSPTLKVGTSLVSASIAHHVHTLPNSGLSPCRM